MGSGATMKGRLALITGASSGIGAATARALVRGGCDVILVGRRESRLEQEKSLLLEVCEGARVETLVLDVSSRDAVERAVRDIGAQGDSAQGDTAVDILINNAGLALGTETAQEGDPDDWDQMLDTNVKGLLYMTRALLPGMIARGRGDIVNIGSVAGRWSYRGGTVYCATKAAVRAITESLRLDLMGTPVRVMNIAPGMVETEFSDIRFRGDTKKAKDVYAGMTPLSPHDIADAIVWSLSRPAHVNVQEMILFPTDQPGVGHVHRRG